MSANLRERRGLGRNATLVLVMGGLVFAGALAAFVLLVYLVSIVRMGGG